MFQVVWKPVQNRAPDLFNFIENFSFDWGEYVELLGLYTEGPPVQLQARAQ